MHLEGRTRLRLEAATNWLPRWLAVLFPISIAGSVLGQSVLAPPPGFQNAPATPQPGTPSWGAPQAGGLAGGQNNPENASQPGNNAPASGPTEGQSGDTTSTPAAAAPVQGLMRWGALHLRGSATYQFLYSTGLHSSPGQSSDTITHTLTPAVTAALGPHVSLSYSPSFRFFTQRDFHNTIDHFVSLSAGFSVEDWSFGLSQSFSRSDEPMVETSAQTDQENFVTGLSASYHFNDKVSFDTGGSMSVLVIGHNNDTNVFGGGTGNLDSNLSDSQSYSGSEFVNYQFDEKLTGGLGVTVGYSSQDGGFRSLSEQYLGRVTWQPGSKLTLFINGGIENEQFLNIDAPAIVTPIFSATATYQMFEQTTLSLAASRAINASLFQREITESNQVGISLRQRLLGLLQLTVGFSYGTTDYKDTFGNLVVVRSDESTSYNIGLGFPFLKHGNFSTFYSYTDNSSSLNDFGYSTSQVGAVLSWAY
jgi:Putative beta-barrel porin 2